MFASKGMISINGKFFFNSSSTSYKGLSACSNKIKQAGLKRQICLHSSDPIEPPAPVTMTILSRMVEPIRSCSKEMTSRPSKSLYAISLMAFKETFPSINSPMPGSVLKEISLCSQLDTICRICSAVIEDIAIKASFALKRTAILSISEVGPRMGRPWILFPIFSGSSSINPTTLYFKPALSCISRNIFSP